jgi:bifunctional enzyme CysN/CysC
MRSDRTAWHDGPTLLQHLETADVSRDLSSKPFRFAVQWVNRPNLDFRGFAGTVASGLVSIGDNVVVAATGATSKVARIITFDGDLDTALPGDAVTLTLASEIDVTRGDLLVHPDSRPECVDQVAAHVLWMSEDDMLPGRSYLMRVGTAETPASITTLKHKIDVNTLENGSGRTLALNEIGYCNIATARSIAFDPYGENRRTGAFILIDRTTNATAGAGMICFGLRRATNIHRQHHAVDKAARSALMRQKPRIVWFTGLSGSGKSTIADLVEKSLHAHGVYTMLLDGDNLRHGLNRDLGFTEADRVENIRRVGEVAKLFVDAGLVVLCCFISPFGAERSLVRSMVAADEFVEVFVDLPVEECIKRDPKGLYRKALAGELSNFTGVHSPYEAPTQCEIKIDGTTESAEAAAGKIIAWLGGSSF